MSQFRFRAQTLRDNAYSTQYPAPTERVIDMSTLNGGLNLWELDYRMGKNQSPDCLNVYWQDGCLSSRPGQSYIFEQKSTGTQYGDFVSCYDRLWESYIVAHKGTSLYKIDPSTGVHTSLQSGVGTTGGMFFVFDSDLYYFTGNGGYYKITPAFVVSSLTGYIPTVIMNRLPNGTGGDQYQAENRISAYKKVLFTAYYVERYASQSAFPTTGNTYTYYYSIANSKYYTYAEGSGYAESEFKPNKYYLPYTSLSSGTVVRAIASDGQGGLEWVTYTEVPDITAAGVSDTSYQIDLVNGIVLFKKEPYQTHPSMDNTVEIQVNKPNTDAYNSIMKCKCATVFGGDTDLTVVVGGTSSQPNAYFWSGNTSIGVDPTYFPMDYYNYAGGNADEYITGFGKQQSMLVIFKEHSIGKVVLSSVTLDERDYLTLPYTSINDTIGCDVPGSIKLVQNNLLFANTYGGVYVLLSTTSYGENSVKHISRNIDGDGTNKGLLKALRGASPIVTAFDDNTRYWLAISGECYLWDYTISTYHSDEENLTWFYFGNINSCGWIKDTAKQRFFMANGSLGVFTPYVFNDFGQAMVRRYTFATQNFGTYEVLKNVRKVIFAVRSDTDSEMDITYHTDYELRKDLTPIRARGWHLVPRNLTYRNLRPIAFGYSAVRTPRCFHVRHFAMVIENKSINTDMSVVSAQIFFTYCRKDR